MKTLKNANLEPASGQRTLYFRKRKQKMRGSGSITELQVHESMGENEVHHQNPSRGFCESPPEPVSKSNNKKGNFWQCAFCTMGLNPEFAHVYNGKAWCEDCFRLLRAGGSP